MTVITGHEELVVPSSRHVDEIHLVALPKAQRGSMQTSKVSKTEGKSKHRFICQCQIPLLNLLQALHTHQGLWALQGLTLILAQPWLDTSNWPCSLGWLCPFALVTYRPKAN